MVSITIFTGKTRELSICHGFNSCHSHYQVGDKPLDQSQRVCSPHGWTANWFQIGFLNITSPRYLTCFFLVVKPGRSNSRLTDSPSFNHVKSPNPRTVDASTVPHLLWLDITMSVGEIMNFYHPLSNFLYRPMKSIFSPVLIHHLKPFFAIPWRVACEILHHLVDGLVQDFAATGRFVGNAPMV